MRGCRGLTCSIQRFPFAFAQSRHLDRDILRCRIISKGRMCATIAPAQASGSAHVWVRQAGRTCRLLRLWRVRHLCMRHASFHRLVASFILLWVLSAALQHPMKERTHLCGQRPIVGKHPYQNWTVHGGVLQGREMLQRVAQRRGREVCAA